MEGDERQHLADQRAANGQTLVFVADRQAEMASTADQMAKDDPGWSTVAAVERERRKTLMEVALEEKRLATAINLGKEPPAALAAMERELRKDLLEVARAEGRTAEQLQAMQSEDDPTATVLAEQAGRIRDLLRHVAETATRADRELRTDSNRT